MSTPRPGDRVTAALTALLLAAAGGVLAWAAVVSLQWRMEIDTPLLHYMAFAVDYGVVPYEELFVTSFPGAILFHLAVIRVVGTGDQAFMAANLVWLVLLLAATLVALRPLGRRVGLAAWIFFGLVYMHGGAYIALQRDGVLILPVIAGAALGLAERGRVPVRAFLCGLSFGLAASIKPHAAIGLPAVLLLGAFPRGGTGVLVRRFAWASLGFALPFLGITAWLASTGGLPAFVDMMRSYLPLHLELSGHHEQLQGGVRFADLLRGTLEFGPESNWLLGGVSGLVVLALAWRSLDGRARRAARLFLCLWGLYLLYPALAGQFWYYHWLPFEYFTAVGCALCLLDPPPLRRFLPLRLVPLGLLVATLVIARVTNFPKLPKPPTPAQIAGQVRMSKRTAYHYRVARISSYLERELRPGDTVQPLEWSGGGVHAMLRAKARIATPFVSNYHFYHHVDDPYVLELRRTFLEQMEADPPRFVLDLTESPRPFGEGTGPFEELDRWLEENYRPVVVGRLWAILEHRGS